MPDWKNMDTWDKIKEVLGMILLVGGVIALFSTGSQEPLLAWIAAKLCMISQGGA